MSLTELRFPAASGTHRAEFSEDAELSSLVSITQKRKLFTVAKFSVQHERMNSCIPESLSFPQTESRVERTDAWDEQKRLHRKTKRNAVKDFAFPDKLEGSLGSSDLRGGLKKKKRGNDR